MPGATELNKMGQLHIGHCASGTILAIEQHSNDPVWKSI